jgi:biopolymer transport protein ExbB
MPTGAAVGLALAVLVVAPAVRADNPAAAVKPGGGGGGADLDALAQLAGRVVRVTAGWYQATPPADRVTWGGLIAAAGLGLGILLERMARLRRGRILPGEFSNRFLGRLRDGKLDRGKALDFCELNPSPAARVALAAVRRWGRPTADLERAVGLAHRVEADRLRRNVGTLRRIAALAPLLGLLGTLVASGRALSAVGSEAAGPAWGPALAAALAPLTAGVAIATLALVAYDGLAGRVEALVAALDRAGAETVDAIAMALPPEPRPSFSPGGPTGPARTPHQHPIRLEIPNPPARAVEDEDDF